MAFGQTLVDSRLLGMIADFFPSACTVEEATAGSGSYGETESTWGNLSVVVGVACRIAPATQVEPLNAVTQYAIATNTAVLKGYYSTIRANMRATIDGVVYDITGVAFDDEGLQTRLDLRKVDP